MAVDDEAPVDGDGGEEVRTIGDARARAFRNIERRAEKNGTGPDDGIDVTAFIRQQREARTTALSDWR